MILVFPLGGMGGSCDGLGLPGGPGCNPLEAASVRLTITDDQGSILPFATITFQVNGGQQAFTFCDGNCDDIAIAFGAVGRFDVTVSRAGFLDADRTVFVRSQDGCHPDTETLIVVMVGDQTIGALAGAWQSQTLFGDIALRFGESGEIIGAILFDRTIAGDGNFYISYNNRPIRGVPGQQIAFIGAVEPVRNGDLFEFVADTLGVPVGFLGARMFADFSLLTGAQPGVPPGLNVTYTRLSEIPEALLDP